MNANVIGRVPFSNRSDNMLFFSILIKFKYTFDNNLNVLSCGWLIVEIWFLSDCSCPILEDKGFLLLLLWLWGSINTLRIYHVFVTQIDSL